MFNLNCLESFSWSTLIILDVSMKRKMTERSCSCHHVKCGLKNCRQFLGFLNLGNNVEAYENERQRVKWVIMNWFPFAVYFYTSLPRHSLVQYLSLVKTVMYGALCTVASKLTHTLYPLDLEKKLESPLFLSQVRKKETLVSLERLSNEL